MEANLDEPQFRLSLRQWLTANAPVGLAESYDWNGSTSAGWRNRGRRKAVETPLFRAWEELWLSAGLVCAHWPSQYGGRGWSRRHRVVMDEELHRLHLPPVDRGRSEYLIGPSIIACGTEEQKLRLLPPIIAGDHDYAQGFSEPGSGSDLASLQTRAVVEGDQLVIHGQKTWSSSAADANMVYLLCRTGVESTGHHGITAVLVPLDQEGVEVRPIRQMTGESEFADIFFDGARAPLSNVLGELGEGWKVAMTTLTIERDFNLPLIALNYRKELDDLRDLVREREAADSASALLGFARTNVRIMEYMGVRLVDGDAAEVASLVSASKLHWSEYHQWVTEQAMDVGGADSLLRPVPAGEHDYSLSAWQYLFLYTRADTIYAGSTQVQKNILAERVLGLPR